ncbi:hypothetical protein [Ulvibacter antarcticus]|uniref:Uncharacterized protein n=1 Tax=Ulvibacter antarcticus TaxID=442714 RepID=A0A3L9YCX4_9FLAO|nr:hypothetical protein [Ulvibacter antarcticus]RMA58501.1 hypothetical protein BXY75_1874 [Ulvibacter antarcticus]
MNSKQVDLVNIGLIVVSLWIAIKLPFELFLFSYAVLGPLHYLTEINWLKEKNYFVKPNSLWITIFFIFAGLLALYPVVKLLDVGINVSEESTIGFISTKGKMLLLTGFLFAISLIFFKKAKHMLLSLLASFFISVSMYLYVPSSVYIFGLFLPTILHVYLFTLLFMIYGTTRSKSRNGVYAAVLLFLVPIAIIFLNVDETVYSVSTQTAGIMDESNMLEVNYMIAKIFGGVVEEGKFYHLSALGIKIQIFIAFAYTYHYLNWFSKTTVIGWKNSLTKKKSALILFIWISSIAIYYYDYATGLVALFFLSFLHVFLEFPLNVITIKGLFDLRKSKKVSKPAKVTT